MMPVNVQLGKNQKVREQKCSHCCHITNAAAQFGDIGDAESTPDVNDVCICVNCGEWNIIGADGKYRKLTDDEYLEAMQTPGFKEARDLWVRAFGKVGPRSQTK